MDVANTIPVAPSTPSLMDLILFILPIPVRMPLPCPT
jgi:hypothetical protein